MGIIKLLPPEISNKIAAGEVVERPQSVVKELVENAIDAGADLISVEIRNGGVRYIRVSDNGKGMEKNDAQTAFLRHATSKIRSENDLDAIYTLGFRGEALSSIGAVSQVDLFTKRREDEEGTHVMCLGGEIKSDASSAVGTPDGTTFVVHNLFFNTPARMNFLKRDASEAALVTDIMERFILSHPEISFRYTIDGKDKYFTSGDGQLINSVYAVYGKNYAKSVIPVDYETELVKITGVIGKGDAARPNRNYQSFFVNKRYVKSIKISGVLENAYKNQIMIGKHPMAVLNIEINPKFTDINVHPTKLEVKFSREEDVLRAIFHCVENALYAMPNVPQIERQTAVKSEFKRDSADLSSQVAFDVPTEDKKELPEVKVFKPDFSAQDNTAAGGAAAENATVREKADNLPQSGKEADNAKTENNTEVIVPGKNSTYALDASDEYFLRKQKELVDTYLNTDKVPVDKLRENRSEWVKYNIIRDIEKENRRSSFRDAAWGKDNWGFDRRMLRVIGQVFDTYILAEAGDTMIIADQHAAHERLKFEELKKELANKKVTSQMLLVPVLVKLSPNEYVTYCRNKSCLESMGFELKDNGDNSVLIHATPEALDAEELENMLIEILDNMAKYQKELVTEKMERALYTIACKAAVKANRKFDNKQLEVLLNAVLDMGNINTCPHGRPIIITMSKKELEKDFKRII